MIQCFPFSFISDKTEKNTRQYETVKRKIQLLGTKTHHGGVSEKSATIFWPLCGQFHF